MKTEIEIQYPTLTLTDVWFNEFSFYELNTYSSTYFHKLQFHVMCLNIKLTKKNNSRFPVFIISKQFFDSRIQKNGKA